MTKKLLLLIFITLSLRLISLNQSLWLDEAISANVVKNYSYQNIITKFSPSDFHPPLYYLTLKSWSSVFGFSQIGLRSFSVFCSLLTIILVYLYFGFCPSLLLSLNPLCLYYSGEARMYSLVTMLVFLSFLSFKKNNKLLYVVFTFLSLSTFYGSIFFFASISLYFLLKKDYKNFIFYSLSPVLSLLILSPLLIVQYQNSREVLKSVLNWSSVLGSSNLKNLLLIPIKFTIGRISFYPKVIYYLISFVLVVPLWSLLFLKSFKSKQVSFVFWTTLFIGFIFSIFTPMFQYFRFLYLIPFLCIIINKNIFYSFIFLLFSSVYLFNPVFHREDWKSLSASLPSKVYMISSFADPIKYYKNIEISDIRQPILENTITVVPYGESIHDFDHNNYLNNLGYKKISTNNFRELTSENWVKTTK
ncbi:MAG: hypothetical protein WC069_03090 [Candidatus Shapirobacteria bacterium]